MKNEEVSIFIRHVLYYNHIDIMCESKKKFQRRSDGGTCLQGTVQGKFLFINLLSDFNETEL